MRLFAAFALPDEIGEEIAAWWTAARVHLESWGWRSVPPENWHVTLAFYGEVPGAGVDALAEALEAEAGAAAPFALTTRGLGVFPRAARPRVFWLGVEEADGRGRLRRFARACMRALDAAGRRSGKQRAQKQPFVGHLTLARLSGEPFPMEMSVLEDLPAPPTLGWTADELVLYASRLHPDGARYRVLERFPLLGGER